MRVLRNFVFPVFALLNLKVVSCGTGLRRVLRQDLEIEEKFRNDIITAFTDQNSNVQVSSGYLREWGSCDAHTKATDISLDNFLSNYSQARLHKGCELHWQFVVKAKLETKSGCCNIKWTAVQDSVEKLMKDVDSARLMAVEWQGTTPENRCNTGWFYTGGEGQSSCARDEAFFRDTKKLDSVADPMISSLDTSKTYCPRKDVNLLDKKVKFLAISFPYSDESFDVEFHLALIREGNGTFVQPFDYNVSTDLGECKLKDNEVLAEDHTDWSKVDPGQVDKGTSCNVTRTISHPLANNFDKTGKSVGTYYSEQIPVVNVKQKQKPSHVLKLLDVVVSKLQLAGCSLKKGSNITDIYLVKGPLGTAAVNAQSRKLVGKVVEVSASAVELTFADGADLDSPDTPLLLIKFPDDCKVDSTNAADGLVVWRFQVFIEGNRDSGDQTKSKPQEVDAIPGSLPNFFGGRAVVLLAFWMAIA